MLGFQGQFATIRRNCNDLSTARDIPFVMGDPDGFGRQKSDASQGSQTVMGAP